MNKRAQHIGLTDSQFKNTHGMAAEGQHMTAYDMALLARRYIEEHPEALALYSERVFEYHGIQQHNRNTLLHKDIGVDGLITRKWERFSFRAKVRCPKRFLFSHPPMFQKEFIFSGSSLAEGFSASAFLVSSCFGYSGNQSAEDSINRRQRIFCLKKGGFFPGVCFH